MNKFKLALSVLGSTFLLAACGGNAEEGSSNTESTGENGSAALVISVSGLGDQGFNDLALRGVKKAEEDLGISYDYAEPQQVTDYELIIRDLASSGEYDVIISNSIDQVDALTKVSSEFPEQKFAMVDGIVDAPNVASYVFNEEEGSFVVGALAGMMTKNAETYGLGDKTDAGFIAAMQIPLLDKFNFGYQAGIKYVNPDASVLVDYVSGDNPFGDTATGKEIALSQNNRGAGIIYHAAGGSGLGVYQAAAEANFYAIGVNDNQNHLDPDHIVASMLKKVDEATFNIVEAATVNDNLSVGEATYLGLAENGLDYTFEGSNVEVSQEIKDVVEAAKQAVINGDVKVPKTQAEFDAFDASAN